MVTPAAGTIVLVPFPFSDLSSSKRRKALVISSEEFNKSNKATTVVMITSRLNSVWAGDINISEWKKAGLKKPCYVRLKFFTADNEILLEKVGSLQKVDKQKVIESFGQYIIP